MTAPTARWYNCFCILFVGFALYTHAIQHDVMESLYHLVTAVVFGLLSIYEQLRGGGTE